MLKDLSKASNYQATPTITGGHNMSGKNDKSTPSATTPPESNNQENSAFKNNGLQRGKRQTLPPSSGISVNDSLSPRRRRTEQDAKSILKGAGLQDRQMAEALRHLQTVKQPIRFANNLVQRATNAKKGMEVKAGAKLDLSDAQELKTKLIKRDFGIWSPHSDYLRRIVEDILSGKITKAEFEKRSAVLLSMDQPLSEDFRKAEWKLTRTEEWK